MKKRKLIFETHEKGVWHSLDDAVKSLIPKVHHSLIAEGFTSMLDIYIIGIVQYNLYYRDYLRDNGIDALIALLIEEAPVLNEYQDVLTEVRTWGANPKCIGDYDIQCCHINSRFKVFGTTFKGLKDFLKNHKDKGVYIYSRTEDYPCFDSFDSTHEKRYYANYFLSDKSFSDEQIAKYHKVPIGTNYNMASESLQPCHLPMIYYGGDGSYMYLATERKNK